MNDRHVWGGKIYGWFLGGLVAVAAVAAVVSVLRGRWHRCVIIDVLASSCCWMRKRSELKKMKIMKDENRSCEDRE